MAKPLFYTAFHLNLAFSSIEESDRATVIDKCYWPLLKLAENGIPIGIEATSYTLKAIQAVAPEWIESFKSLIAAGKVELVASGFVQMIAPLVPPEVTEWNLKLGLQDYNEMLGVKPRIALINEQAYSAGLVNIYKDAGFEAVMMDWAEPASHHSDWPKNIMHQPANLIGHNDVTLPVVWSDAISFQKFQRYVHGELAVDEYFEFINLQLEKGVKAFPLYTSDGEVFDYRPGRFEAEAAMDEAVEHTRIEILFKSLHSNDQITQGLPSDALAMLNKDVQIKLETAQTPVPVKKQRKYNITRWAVSGRADLKLNTHCWRLFEAMKVNGNTSESEWRTLCEFWASDFRTHITEKRWSKLLERLPEAIVASDAENVLIEETPDNIEIKQERRFLTIQTETSHLVLNIYRGLAIQAFGFGALKPFESGAPAENSLIGTLSHGFYDDIEFGADFYSGHLVCEPANSHKVTDLSVANYSVNWNAKTQCVYITGSIETRWGRLVKNISFNIEHPQITISYEADWLASVEANVRLGHVTINPRAFNVKDLYYSTHSGSEVPDIYPIDGDIDHGKPVSRLVSATTGLGMTGGTLTISDKEHSVTLKNARTDFAGVGMMKACSVGESYFLRAMISAGEVDETASRSAGNIASHTSPLIYQYSIELNKLVNSI